MKHTEETKKKISESRKGKCLGNKNGFKKGQTVWNKGLKGIHLSLKSEFKKGQIAPMKGRQRPDMIGNKQRAGLSAWNKGIKYPQVTGDRNPNWKGGISKINKTERQLIMETIEYKLWRRSVFARDGYACIECGDNTSGNLNADHIKPFALFPELRFAMDNGRTLYVPCHKNIGWSLFKDKNPRKNFTAIEEL